VTARISQKVAVGAVFVAAMFMSIMDTTIVNVALPTIGRDFAVSPTAVDSISIAYLVSLAVFAAGALVAATASSVLALAAGRCLQGAAAAASVPSALRLLTTITAEGPARHRAIAAWSAAGAAAGASGFVVGGIVTDLTSWRVILWAYLPLAAALAAGFSGRGRPG